MNSRSFSIVIVLIIANLSWAAHAQQSYREKYAGVLSHYSLHESDSLKYKAALFLVDNMDGHLSPEGTGMEEFVRRVHSFREFKGIRELMDAWNQAHKNGKTQLVPDSSVVSNEYLIENIEDAFRCWHASPWKEEIDFKQFCDYILPYRAKDERISQHWRSILRDRYLPCIEHIRDMKQAFVAVRDTILNSIALSNSYTAYTYDVLTADYIKRADCDQRCVLLVAVLRALGIPSAIDGVPMWADYSTKGHAWVSLVLRDGATFTVFENDKEPKQYNKVDASQFKMRYKVKPEDHCPYPVKTEKTVAKVYRMAYSSDFRPGPDAPASLSDPFARDVSADYGLTAKVSLHVNDTLPVYLCVFLTGANWMPVAQARPDSMGNVEFSNIGQPVVYMAVQIKGKQWVPIAEPFLVADGKMVKYYKVKPDKTESVTLHRKYPLYSYITDQWGFMKGGVFEGANEPDFRDAEELGRISTMPYGETEVRVNNQGRFRFLRYRSPDGNRTSLAELRFYSKNGSGTDTELRGAYLSQGVDSAKVELAFDRKLDTNATAKDVGFWIGMDLGENNERQVSKIYFAPTSDTNTVEPGHLYELYYFDTSWHFIGRQLAKGCQLTFNHVPCGALLLLKDKTKGQEERIFEYNNHQQIWY